MTIKDTVKTALEADKENPQAVIGMVIAAIVGAIIGAILALIIL